MFRSFWCADIKNDLKKNIILIHFWMKNTLKSNHNHPLRQVSLCSLGYYLFYLKWFIELECFFQFHYFSILLYIKLGPHSFNYLYIYNFFFLFLSFSWFILFFIFIPHCLYQLIFVSYLVLILLIVIYFVLKFWMVENFASWFF